MSVGDAMRKAAASAAGVAMATAGLSSCKNGLGGGLGAVDPPPPPLQCNSVNLGQTLQATATRGVDSVTVSIRHVGVPATWRSPRVTAVSGASIGRTVTPPDGSLEPFQLVFPLAGATSASISFTFEGQLAGESNSICIFRRNFIVTVTPAAVTIAQISLDQLPLPARQRAEIVVLAQAGRTVTLEATTPYRGALLRTWDVSAGTLSDPAAPQVTWTLPEAPGIYSAEVALDYGADGLAFDVLMLEVLPAANAD